MFKLQRLEITGFKSFADYTEIVFTGNGITAVVGPNGCGKSNVSDCISWVLGEQRAKSLRGGEMKDVVFQGSKNRKPSGMAEVVLHLVRDEDHFDSTDDELHEIDQALHNLDENAVDMDVIEGRSVVIGFDSRVTLETNGFHGDDLEEEKVHAAHAGSIQTVERTIKTKRHWRPRPTGLEFAPGEAVSVTRRLYLSGESEYQLNGRDCRLRDIQDLFAGTGLSGAHYAIVEQGRIGQILSAKPSDRRNLIEEAAGISKFRTRQRAAESRLESAKLNLRRISDIVSEIDKQANSLRRQAGKTRRFMILQEEFRAQLEQLFAAEGHHYSALLDELKSGLDNAISIEKDFSERVSKMEAAFREATEAARSVEENLTEIRRKHAENALERDRDSREFNYKSEQIVNLSDRLQTLTSENGGVKERLKLAHAEIARLKIAEKTENAEADASMHLLLEAEKQWSAKVATVKEIEARLEQQRGSLFQHTSAVERFNELRHQLDLNVERLSERSETLNREGVRAEQTFVEHTTDAAKVADDLKIEREKLDDLHIEKNEILVVLANARETLSRSTQLLKQLQEDFSRKKHRLETLEELEANRAVYNPQVQKLFSEQAKIGVKLLGVLADFLNVAEKAERAVEVLMGSYLQAVLVDSISDAVKVSTWVRENKTGRVATLVVDSSQLKKISTSNSGPTIGENLGTSDSLTKSLQSVFPRELSARLVDNFGIVGDKDTDISIDYTGNVSIGGQLFVGGDPSSEGQNASLLAFKRELADLGKSVENLSREFGIAESRCGTDRGNLADNEEKMVDLQSLIIKIERGLLGVELQEKSILHDIERADRHRQVVTAESAQVKFEIEQNSIKLDEALSGSGSAEKLRVSAADEMASTLDQLNAARLESENENAVLNEKRTHAATSGERRRSVQFALRRIENEVKELETRLNLHHLEIAEIEEKIRQMRSTVVEIEGRLGDADDAASIEQSQSNDAVNAVDNARKIADEASRQLADLNRRSAEAVNGRGAVEVRQTEVITLLKNLNEKCNRELNLSLVELLKNEPPEAEFELENAKSLVEEQRQRLEGFGAINMLALEELTETEERLNFLTSQRKDIIDSIESAEEGLREIKERSRTKFKEAFEAVNANFIEFFSELFGGGRGEMTLLESDDILEAGIEIVAQPPGKRLQNILLLSGGEKAMTAIALVLAIFKYRPSPFCLLDEVDAPLDDANVGRFVNKIADMSEKTQFIVITHNKRTMEAARALYGVTMQEPGVSKVVSVKFN